MKKKGKVVKRGRRNRPTSQIEPSRTPKVKSMKMERSASVNTTSERKTVLSKPFTSQVHMAETVDKAKRLLFSDKKKPVEKTRVAKKKRPRSSKRPAPNKRLTNMLSSKAKDLSRGSPSNLSSFNDIL